MRNSLFRSIGVVSVFFLVMGLRSSLAQNFSALGNNVALDASQLTGINMNMFLVNGQNANGTPLQTPANSVSMLDIKAPGKAQHEYDKGYQLLMRKDLQGAVDHLSHAINIYSNYVAAHNALGTAYLTLGQKEQARDQFAQAVALDDHLPSSYLNLGCAQLSLEEYPGAEESLRKASAIAPLDLQLLVALTYAEFKNHDYPAVITTAEQVHNQKHKNAAIVHFFAAGAQAAQNNLGAAQHEMETLLQEDPQSASAEQYRAILQELISERIKPTESRLQLAQPTSVFIGTAASPEQASQRARGVLQEMTEKRQIAEAEAEDEQCSDCSLVASNSPAPLRPQPGRSSVPTTLRISSEEVGIFFSATDHGKPVPGLTPSDIELFDDHRPPAVIRSFRNESELPLRLGLVIDTSDSIATRLTFEKAAATKFLESVVTGKDDLSFVVGVNNSILLVQDFTADQTLAAHGVGQLAPGGGTALWDGVAFSADKLAKRREDQPVSRVLVVISDGKDNSSSATLKQAMAAARRGDVAVYTVSTRELDESDPGGDIGEHALRTLSEMTGGAAFAPSSVHSLGGSLTELQQVIRSRYLVAYKPAAFKADGHYRTIELTAQKDGHKLKVFARKGYYAGAEAGQ
jgi:Ca-activated chloride channel homolog